MMMVNDDDDDDDDDDYDDDDDDDDDDDSYPLIMSKQRLNMAIDIVSFPNGGSFHSYVKLPEGKHGDGD